MAEYCRQCHDELFPPDSGFMTTVRNAKMTCEQCGITVVDNRGRCTGSCGEEAHSSNFMDYVFETKSPKLVFVCLNTYTPRTYLYKILVDTIQWIPRFTFVACLIYLLAMSIRIRLMEVRNKEDLDMFAELATARASRVYEASFKLWYKKEMQIEQLLF